MLAALSNVLSLTCPKKDYGFFGRKCGQEVVNFLCFTILSSDFLCLGTGRDAVLFFCLRQPEALAAFTGYSLSEIGPCLQALHRACLDAPRRPQQAVREKYKAAK